MKYLIDTNPHKIESWVNDLPDFVAGQLIVPAATRKNWGGVFGMDNSAFISFDNIKFKRMQKNQAAWKDNCLFVTCPDIVGNAKRTMEIWKHRDRFSVEFRLCLVVQNGMEDMDIPWDETDAIFIGGKDPWKDSAACLDIVKTGVILEKHVHCGRVNQIKRYKTFAEAGAHTCDGSSIAIHDYKLRAIANEYRQIQNNGLFDMDDSDLVNSGEPA